MINFNIAANRSGMKKDIFENEMGMEIVKEVIAMNYCD